MGEGRKQISIPLRELFYSRDGKGFFRDDPNSQRNCLLIENDYLEFDMGMTHSYFTNEVSARTGNRQMVPCEILHDKELPEGLIRQIMEGEFLFIHAPAGVNLSNLPEKVREKIFSVDMENTNITDYSWP